MVSLRVDRPRKEPRPSCGKGGCGVYSVVWGAVRQVSPSVLCVWWGGVCVCPCVRASVSLRVCLCMVGGILTTNGVRPQLPRYTPHCRNCGCLSASQFTMPAYLISLTLARVGLWLCSVKTPEKKGRK